MLTAPTAFTSSLAAFTSSRATIRVTQARWPPEGRGKPGNPLLCLRDRTCEGGDRSQGYPNIQPRGFW
jgi:hypothetical protein